MIEFVNKIGVELIEASASDDMVALAAWVSNGLDDEARLEDRDKVKGLINFLYRNKHMSPFEHGHFTFKIDAPLFVVREWHRHRTMSYNEVSGRYTQMKPRFWRANTARVQQGKMGNYFFVDGSAEQTALYRRKKELRLQAAWDDYVELLDAGIAKEQAREDMPLSMMTQFYATTNPRNLMQFLTLRNDAHALAEIRDAAVQVENLFSAAMPLTHAAYRAGRDEQTEFEQWKNNISNVSKIQYAIEMQKDVDPAFIAREVAKKLRRQGNLRKGPMR